MFKLINISKFSSFCIIYKCLVKHWSLNISLKLWHYSGSEVVDASFGGGKVIITLFSLLTHSMVQSPS